MRAYNFQLDKENTNVLSYAKNKYITRLFNSLSLLFPVGEKFFANSVRYYKSSIPEALQQETQIFIKEEAQHSREHMKLNALLKAEGFDTDKLEAVALKALHRYGKTPRRALIVTTCLEIFTAYGAELLLTIDKVVLKQNSASNMWRWHATEEAGEGHRSCAHKVLKEVTKVSSIEIAFWFILVTVMLVRQTTINYIELSK
jgi:predicted metal-dependent hydrolase